MAYRIAIADDQQARLHNAGVQGMVFVQRPIDLEASVGLIEATTVSGRPKIIKSAKQIEAYDHIYKNPFKVPYVMCISSTRTDLRAKYVAAHLLNRAIDAYNVTRYTTTRLLPAWHTLTGSYQDEIRDRIYQTKKGKKPALAVFSNVAANSSEVKLEKLRDLLELYADVPRVVAITGEDPYTFFANLHYPLNVGLYLSKGSLGTYQRKGVPPKRPAEEERKTSKPAKKKPTTSKTSEI